MAEEAETTETTQEQPMQESGSKTFTQADVVRIVADRLARERKNQPDPEKAFEDWKQSRKTEAEKAAETAKKLEEAETEAERLRRENAVIRSGVNADDTDYVLFKVGQMDGVFSENLKKFPEDNPGFTAEPSKRVPDSRHEPSRSDNIDRVVITAVTHALSTALDYII